jgi:hypothetical protein
MHGIFQSAPDSAASAEKMVIDPVCRMTIDPAAAAAREVFEASRCISARKAVAIASWQILPPMRQRLLRRRWAATRNAVRSQPAMICGG